MLKKDIRDRFEGTLLGLAVGDALGAPVEYVAASIHGRLEEMVGGGRLNLKPGQCTDDTDMMLCIAESLVASKGYNPDDIAQRFVSWYKSDPQGMGSTTRMALARIAGGVSWKNSGDKDKPKNGSVMRCAPIGLFFASDERKLIEASIETSAMTHAHQDAALSCVLINIMIASLVQGKNQDESLDCALSYQRGNINSISDEFYWKCIDGFLFHDELNPASGRALDTALLAVKRFIYTNSFEEAVVSAVNLGGDTDTIGAVTGALAGAYWGASAIPERWSSKINPYTAADIKAIGEKIFELANL